MINDKFWIKCAWYFAMIGALFNLYVLGASVFEQHKIFGDTKYFYVLVGMFSVAAVRVVSHVISGFVKSKGYYCSLVNILLFPILSVYYEISKKGYFFEEQSFFLVSVFFLVLIYFSLKINLVKEYFGLYPQNRRYILNDIVDQYCFQNMGMEPPAGFWSDIPEVKTISESSLSTFLKSKNAEIMEVSEFSLKIVDAVEEGRYISSSMYSILGDSLEDVGFLSEMCISDGADGALYVYCVKIDGKAIKYYNSGSLEDIAKALGV